MRILYAATAGFFLDLLLGDPPWIRRIHPVVLMGRAISALENRMRSCFKKTETGEFLAGLVTVLIMAGGTAGLSAGSLFLLNRLWPPLAFALEVFWCWMALAVRDLRDEAVRVQDALETQGLKAAREAVSRIVGRDTVSLSEEGVARAAVETVAENFADGIVAPLFYMMIGGAPLALCCKAVNTMDSMLGYRNERYLYFGRAAAKLDDAVNFIPARLGALLLIIAAPVTGEDAGGALRIWRRDRRRHLSPNSAQCEAAMAGALGLRLCGPASYDGVLHEKPWIGDEKNQIRPADIRRACRMDYAGAVLALILFGIIRLAVIRWS